MDAIDLLRCHHRSGDRELHTKLQCLQLSATREALAGDPGRKAEIVFDLGAGACLAAGAMLSITIVQRPSDAA